MSYFSLYAVRTNLKPLILCILIDKAVRNVARILSAIIRSCAEINYILGDFGFVLLTISWL